MSRSRLFNGCLTPDQVGAFLPLPNEGDGDGSSSDKQADQDSSGKGSDGDSGYPAETPVAQMTADQQAAYWRAQARKHEERARKADALNAWKAEHAPKLEEYERLVAASKTDHERELDAVKAETAEKAKAEVRAQMIRDLVDAEIRAAAKGALTKDQVSKILAPLDPTYFIADGKVDVDKISTYVAELSPSGGRGAGEDRRSGWPDTGGGRRGAQGASNTVQAGVEMYQRMKNTKTAP